MSRRTGEGSTLDAQGRVHTTVAMREGVALFGAQGWWGFKKQMGKTPKSA